MADAERAVNHHKIISLFKSATRIVGYGIFALRHNTEVGFAVGVTLIIAGEVMGILEEMVGA